MFPDVKSRNSETHYQLRHPSLTGAQNWDALPVPIEFTPRRAHRRHTIRWMHVYSTTMGHQLPSQAQNVADALLHHSNCAVEQCTRTMHKSWGAYHYRTVGEHDGPYPLWTSCPRRNHFTLQNLEGYLSCAIQYTTIPPIAESDAHIFIVLIRGLCCSNNRNSFSSYHCSTSSWPRQPPRSCRPC